MEIYMMGHSDFSQEAFHFILERYGIEVVVDIRSNPASGRYPHFKKETLRQGLSSIAVEYRHMRGLGGFRKSRRTQATSPNAGLWIPYMQEYADYMATERFQRGLGELQNLAAQYRCLLLGVKHKPWLCHRRLLADALTVRDWRVYEVVNGWEAYLQKLTPFAVVNGHNITYPPKLEN